MKTKDRKQIQLEVCFFTNKIGKDGGLIPKHAAAWGHVRMIKNDLHGIKAGRPKIFHTIEELPETINEVLAQNEITLHQVTKKLGNSRKE